jgi:hypothetical protein
VALERLVEGKSSVVGGISGAVVGLVIITPAAGFVRPGWALLMGIWGTVMVYGGILLKRRWTKVDDPLDVFSCHGMGGVYGSLLTGLFCEKAINAGGFDGAFYGNGAQFWDQIAAVLVVVGYSSGITALICTGLHFTIGLKVSKLEAQLGMDNHLTSNTPVDQKRELTNQAMTKVRMTLAGQQAKFTPAEEAHLHHVFSLIDDKHTGKIAFPKFQAALKMMNITLPKDEATALFEKFDSDSNGTIEFEEFRAMMMQANRGSRLSLMKPDVEMATASDPLV